MNKVRSITLVTAMVMSLAALSLQASAQGTETTAQIDLPAQPLAQAIQAVARQASINILVDPRLVEGREAPAVKAELSVQQALNLLLQGTGLTPRYVDDKTITLVTVSPIATKTSADLRAANLRLVQATENAGASKNSAPSSDNSGNKGSVEEIVVTAQRREERLQDVPIAISVLTGEYLDASTGGGVLEELRKIPAVATMPTPEGRAFMVIRGVAPQSGVSTVGYYFDMVPIAFLSLPVAPDADVYDLQRMEILKGPQGTGYGIGSTSGVVRVLTNDPDPSKFDSKGRAVVSSTQGGGTNYRADAAINAPIIDGRLAVRGVFGLENSSGWIDRPNKKDFNDGEATNIRLKVGGELIDGLNTVVGVWHSKRSSGPAASDDSGNRNVLYDETINSSMDVYSFALKKDFGAFSLASSTSYVDLNADYFKRSIFTTVGNVLVNVYSARAFSEEINLASNGTGPLKWTAGVIYRSIEDRWVSKLASLAAINTAALTQDDITGGDSYAGFGELSYSFSQFEVLAGLRYSKEDRDASSGLPGSTYNPEDSFSKVTPRLVLSWKPSRDAMTYLSYAEGFRSGLLQSPVAASLGFGSVKSDLLRNYELGNKATVLGGLLSWEAAVYYMDWQDVQNGVTFPFGGTFYGGLVNAGPASGFGGEVSVTLRPVEGFQIGGSYSQNNLEVDEDVKTAGNTITLFRKGDRLAFSPKTTYGAFADYTAPVGADLEFRVGANLSHFSSQIQRFLLATVTDINNDPFTMVGLNAGIGRKDGSRRVTLFVDNLTNEDAVTANNYSASNPPVGNPDEGLRVRPRTVGLQIEMKF